MNIVLCAVLGVIVGFLFTIIRLLKELKKTNKKQ